MSNYPPGVTTKDIPGWRDDDAAIDVVMTVADDETDNAAEYWKNGGTMIYILSILILLSACSFESATTTTARMEIAEVVAVQHIVPKLSHQYIDFAVSVRTVSFSPTIGRSGSRLLLVDSWWSILRKFALYR